MNDVKVLKGNRMYANFEHSNGREFKGELEGCGEALRIFDVSTGEKITELPTDNESHITQPDLDLACSVLSSIVKTEEVLAKAAKPAVELAVTEPA